MSSRIARVRPGSLAIALALVAGAIGAPAVAAAPAAGRTVPRAASFVVAPAAGPRSCQVTNGGTTYTSLPAATAAAVSGDTLRLRGVCTGTAVVRGVLTIIGVRTATSGRPTVSGMMSRTLFQVRSDATLTLRDLVLRDGWTGGFGGALTAVGAVVTLDDVQVRNNRAEKGGGIYVHFSQLFLEGRTLLRNNRSFFEPGGGIYSLDSAVAMNDDSRVTRNRAFDDYSGGIEMVRGVLEMNDRSRIDRNRAISDGAGGVRLLCYSDCDGFVMTMNDDARIDHNYASDGNGGGVQLGGGRLVMNDRASIDRNTGELGGGVITFGGAESVVMNDSSRIFRNDAKDGGGLSGSATLNDSATISGNVALQDGGGVKFTSLTLNGNARIVDNVAGQEGGGLYSGYQGSVTLSDNAVISGNDAGGQGGGVYMTTGSSLTMEDAATITGNRHDAAENGAGVSYCNSSVTGVTALTNVFANLAPNGPIGNDAATNVIEFYSC